MSLTLAEIARPTQTAHADSSGMKTSAAGSCGVCRTAAATGELRDRDEDTEHQVAEGDRGHEDRRGLADEQFGPAHHRGHEHRDLQREEQRIIDPLVQGPSGGRGSSGWSDGALDSAPRRSLRAQSASVMAQFFGTPRIGRQEPVQVTCCLARR
jgi:hypothetical protein